MSNVYFIPLSAESDADEIRRNAASLFQELVSRESVRLEKELLLKVHFGEKGNRTYLKPDLYDGIIDLLENQGIRPSFAETCVLYGGERFTREKHLKLAASHGFTRLPVVIADGAHGEEAVNVEIGQRHCRTASIAKALADAPQVLVLSHFKGHMLAGFGGAIKQLSMGFGSKGGKMAMHMGAKPWIVNFLCRKCKLCMTRCSVGAITIGKKAKIDSSKCLGCGACFSICRHHAVCIFTFSGIRNAIFGRRIFREKLVEYALAAHRNKRHIYLTFATQITRGCDCEPHPMRICTPPIGIFASLDPVAIDAACFDAVASRGTKFKGVEQLAYAEKIGLGSRAYTQIEHKPVS